MMFGLIGGLIFGFISGLKRGFVSGNIHPNEGIIQNIRNTLLLGIIFYPGCLAMSLFKDWSENISLLIHPDNIHLLDLSFELLISATGFAAFYSFYAADGYVLVQHGCLRWLLQSQRKIPHSYGRFLTYTADELKLLKRSGGRFRFYHDLLREKIAD